MLFIVIVLHTLAFYSLTQYVSSTASMRSSNTRILPDSESEVIKIKLLSLDKDINNVNNGHSNNKNTQNLLLLGITSNKRMLSKTIRSPQLIESMTPTSDVINKNASNTNISAVLLNLEKKKTTNNSKNLEITSDSVLYKESSGENFNKLTKKSTDLKPENPIQVSQDIVPDIASRFDTNNKTYKSDEDNNYNDTQMNQADDNISLNQFEYIEPFIPRTDTTKNNTVQILSTQSQSPEELIPKPFVNDANPTGSKLTVQIEEDTEAILKTALFANAYASNKNTESISVANFSGRKRNLTLSVAKTITDNKARQHLISEMTEGLSDVTTQQLSLSVAMTLKRNIEDTSSKRIVKIGFFVDSKGSVITDPTPIIEESSGNFYIDNDAVYKISQAKFRPFTINNEPVQVFVEMSLKY